MGGSVGEIKLPIVSTFDPAGTTAAKAAMKDLDQAGRNNASGGGGGGGSPPASQSSAASANRAAMENERSAWRHAMQQEGSFLASGQNFSGLESAAAKSRARLADLSPFGRSARVELSQQAAATAVEYEKARKTVRGGLGGGSARAIGDAANGALGELGMGSLGIGASAGAAAVGVYALSQKAAEQAVELRKTTREAAVSVEYYGKLGTASRQAGVGIGETMAGMKKAHQTFASAALEGDVGQGLFLQSLGLTDAQIAAGMDNAESMTQMLAGKNLSGTAKNVLFGSVAAGNAALGADSVQGSFFAPSAGEARSAALLKADTEGAGTKIMGTWSAIGRGVANGRSPFAQMQQDQEDAEDEDRQQRHADAQSRRLQAGIAAANQLASPEERYRNSVNVVNNTDFSFAGSKAPQYKNRGYVRASEENLAAERPFLDTREASTREMENVRAKAANGGYSDETQGRRAEIAVESRLAQALAPVRTTSENLRATLGVEGKKFDLAQDKEDERPMGTHRVETPEMVDAARTMADSIGSYAGGMTAAGPQAAANGINTVAGASQVMTAEYTMDQSREQLNMLGAILNQLVEMHRISQTAARSTYNHAGDRNNDPISQLYGKGPF